MLIHVDNPASGAVIASVSASTVEDVARTITRARAAQKKWATTPYTARAQIIRKLRDALGKESEEFSQLLVEETGKTLTEAHAMEVLPLLEVCDLWATRGKELLDDKPLQSRVAPHKRTCLRRIARGVVGIIVPWNFPLAIGGGEMVMALLAGNAVVLKPSPLAPLAVDRLVALALSAGIPRDVLSVVHGGVDIGRALFDDDSVRCDYIAFTGSTGAGKDVAARCGAQLVPCRVELGGKAVAVVLGDADLDRAAAAIVWGAFCHSGQVCAGVQRVYVDRRVARAFTKKVVSEVAKRTLSKANDPANEVGYLRMPSLGAQLKEFVDDALTLGARLEFGASPRIEERRGLAHVLGDVPHGARILSEECFGPLLAISSAADDDALVAGANSSPFGLLGSVFSEDSRRAKSCAQQLEVANVMVNDVVWSYGMTEIPWFGRKQSGIGTSHGDAGFLELTTMQVVHEERLRVLAREPFWYPYSAVRLRALRLGTSALYGAAQVRDRFNDGLRRISRRRRRKGEKE